MTQDLFRNNAYLTECSATVTAITAAGIVLDRTVFYPLGGGQAGDTGVLELSDGRQIAIVDTRKGKAEDGSFNQDICHLPASDVLARLLEQEQSAGVRLTTGEQVTARIDWARRHRLMRFHTTTHLLCHLVPQLVNGCSITPDYARLDFNMTEALDKEVLSAGLARLVAAAQPVTVGAITDEELDANPALVKSMSVQPPRGSGNIRTVRIGADELLDFQPCGGTHVANTAEIGQIIVTKIEKNQPVPAVSCWALPHEPGTRGVCPRNFTPPIYSHTVMTFTKLFHAPLVAALFVAACAIATEAGAQNPINTVVTTVQVRAELMAHAPDGADAGKTVWLGLQLTHQPGWHTYWKNTGDSGLPTTLQWTLPAGVTAGDIAWPSPKKLPLGNLANYGFDNTVLLPVPLTITSDFKPTLPNNEIEVKLKANWLVCRTVCIPEEGEFVLLLPVQGSTALNGAAFAASFKAQPTPVSGDSRVVVAGNALQVSVAGLPAALQGRTLEFFPETSEVIETAGKWSQNWQGAVWTASVPLSPERSQSPSVMPLVLVLDSGGQRQGFIVQAQVTGDWPPAAAFKTNASRLATPASNSAPLGFWAAVLGALLGGLILNLMPCVFPVLAIKVMSFTRHANDRRGHRVSGLAYSAGVVISFVALGALMLGLRSAGEQLGWGFQLQSPAMVAILAMLFTVMGLNLAGLFEFGHFLPSRMLLLEAKNPSINAFLSGVLAVGIASPCTAPFMGASLGLALGLPPLQALLIFATIGVGMALPYLAASLIPAVARLLPRPGAWMDTFRRAMAFPMFATVVWLVWVLGQQTGIDGTGALLALLVALSGVLWSFTLRGRSRIVVAAISISVGALLIGTIGRNILKPLAVATTASSADRWQAWAPGRVEQLLASGVPVFVDFTAAWCVTCQYNKQTTLINAQVLADLETKKVTLLRADWTRRDPAITAALAQLGRNGVPVYVVYKAGNAPVLLSEILSVQEVRNALATL